MAEKQIIGRRRSAQRLIKAFAVVGVFSSLYGVAAGLGDGKFFDALLFLVLTPIPALTYWRFATVGLIASEEGLRVRNFSRTKTIPWSEISGVEVSGHRKWSWLPVRHLAIQRLNDEPVHVDASLRYCFTKRQKDRMAALAVQASNSRP